MKNKDKQYEKVANGVLEAVGGSANISSVTHCMTRLRFNLKDESKIGRASCRERV